MPKIYKYIIQPGQNLADIAMQEYGGIDALLPLCIDNGFEVGQEVQAGTELVLKDENKVDKKLIAYYESKDHKVASGGQPTDLTSPWILGTGVWDDTKIWIDEETWRDN